MEFAAPNSEQYVDERTLRTLGKMLRDTYKNQVDSELSPKLAALFERLQGPTSGTARPHNVCDGMAEFQ
jgi:hypothetical protein